MILTCPACSTKYVVKDGAIPPSGRQVRCASCKHSWHQDPDPSDAVADGDEVPVVEQQAAAGPESEVASAWSQPPIDEPAHDQSIGEPIAPPPPPIAPPLPDDDRQWAPVEPASAWDEPAPVVSTDQTPEEFAPFYDHEPIDEAPRSKWPILLLLVALVTLAATAFWFLAPAELKARVGIASAGSSELKVMLTNQNRQTLASGNSLFTLSGRIINPTDQRQMVPPIRAELLDAGKHVVYRWTIPRPADALDPNESKSFNAAEVDVPDGGALIRVRLGGPA